MLLKLTAGMDSLHLLSHTCIVAALMSLWVLVIPIRGSKETFSSLANIQKLLVSEVDSLVPILEIHKNLFTMDSQAGSILTKILLRGEKHNGRELEEIHKHAWHPVNCFHLIKEWAVFLHLLELEAENSQDKYTFSKALFNITHNIDVPILPDIRGSAAALLRLQYTYLLDTKSMAQGNIGGYISAPLTAEDMLIIGVSSVKGRYRDLAEDWLYLAMNASSDWEEKRLLETVRLLLKMFPSDEKVQVILAMFKQRHPEGISDFLDDNVQNDLDREGRENYRALCRGESKTRETDLTCRIKQWRNSYITFKEEIMGWSPRISLFYDVISNKDGRIFKRLAQPELFRARVGNPANPEESDDRVGMLSWLWDTDENIKVFSDKVSLVTGLDTTYRTILSSAEPFQVVNYGIGGQYEPHRDAFDLSDVIYGGATVFPDVGVKVPAVKNAAALWYNVRRNGELDFLSLHAGCPVLYGEKWIATKWVREYGNEFTSPCGLEPSSKHNLITS